MAAILSVGLFACSGDDDDDSNSLSVPPYKDSSALYAVTQPGSGYSSFEFTESGNYLIVKEQTSTRALDNATYVMAVLVVSLQQTDLSRSTPNDNIITGKYTKSGNDTYILEGFGVIKVKTDIGNNVMLEITETNRETYILSVAKKEQIPGSERTDKLCRTWHVANLRMTLTGTAIIGNESYDFSFDESVNGGNIADLMYKVFTGIINWSINVSKKGVSQDYVNEVLASEKTKIHATYKTVDNIIFTKAGTNLITYDDGSLAVSTWSWGSGVTNSLHYSWSYKDIDGLGSGNCGVEFYGNHCVLFEETANISIDIIRNANTNIIYTLEEAR